MEVFHCDEMKDFEHCVSGHVDVRYVEESNSKFVSSYLFAQQVSRTLLPYYIDISIDQTHEKV